MAALSVAAVMLVPAPILAAESLRGDHEAAKDVPEDWWSTVQQEVAASEYEITWQNQTALTGLDAAWQAPNRAHGFRSYFTPEGIRVVPRTEPSPSWQWGLALVAYGRGAEAWPLPASSLLAAGNRVDYRRGVLEEWFVNSPRGLEHGFFLPAPPEKVAEQTRAASCATAPPGRGRKLAPDDLVHLDLELTGDLDPVFSTDGLAIDFRTGGGVFVVHYAELKVTDAAGRELSAWMEGFSLTPGRGIRIVVDARDAVYPIAVDPLATSPAWSVGGSRSLDLFGESVASAGDVNGDGYGDVVVGAPYYDSSFPYEGKAFLYLGSASGPSTSPAWTALGGQDWALFGCAVATAGDVNGDGFADVIAGARQYNSAGRALVYLGSTSGLSASPAWTADSDQGDALLGWAVAAAGDVNGDGYGDIIVGAPYYDNGETDEGRAYVYLGSASGLAPSPAWTAESDQAGAVFGMVVSTAGDVNGDGYADVIVGAPLYDNGETDEGRAYVYLGSASGLMASPTWTAEGNHAGAYFGVAAATAGDVNGDGYADVIVGAPFDDNGENDEGRAYVFLGSESGLAPSSSWTTESDQAGAAFGYWVSTAGDVNGDGYADVIVGAPYFDNGQTDEGRAYVFLGSASGLAASSAWTAESDQENANFGDRVATAGDVNGDGYSDVIVGAQFFDGTYPDDGRVFVYLGSASGPAISAGWTGYGDQASADFGFSVATAGDVNGDGFGDVIVGAPNYDNGQTDEGRAYVFPGSASGLGASPVWTAESDQAGARFGLSVATAGDVNGDGYSDVIVGAPYYDNGQTDEGRAYVYHGSASGLSTSPAWTAESDQASAQFGLSVATAGDTNGDGYSDVIVGAPYYDNGQADEGRAFVFHGSSSGLAASPTWTAESDQADSYFSYSVSTAGDVNGDGYSDVIVGAPYFDNGQADEGRAYVYLGSSSGLASSPAWTAESDRTADSFGISVSTAGDVNGDGYSDVIVGAPYFDNGQTDEGRAYVYLGSSSGLASSPAWTAESDQALADFGVSVSTAGDVNGDGYSDVIVGAHLYDNSLTDQGRAYVYLGSASGLAASPAWTADGPAAGAQFGNPVGEAGDVNGDGFADVIVGAFPSDVPLADAGAAYVYYGNGGVGVPLRPQQRRADDAAPIVQGGRSRTPGQFRVASLGRTPFGAGRVKLEWEVKPTGDLFDGIGTSWSAAWSGTGPSGASLDELVSGHEPGTYHWRMRLIYDPASSPFARKSRWFTVPSGGWHEADLLLGSFLGGIVWHDVDRDGIRDTGEPPLGGVTVRLLDTVGDVLDLRSTDGSGGYRFEVQPGIAYRLRFSAPLGWQLTLQDQGADDTLDSDPNAATGETAILAPPFDSFDETGWSAGLVQEGPCIAPDEPVYIYSVRHDSNNWPILDFQDPNQTSQVTGYNVYRSSSPGAPWPWTLVGSNVRDMDAGTANLQWVDQSGDPGTFYYQVNAYNSICNAEGPR